LQIPSYKRKSEIILKRGSTGRLLRKGDRSHAAQNHGQHADCLTKSVVELLYHVRVFFRRDAAVK
jgi:hypothetical protein